MVIYEFFIKRNNSLKEGGAKYLGIALEKLINLTFLNLNLWYIYEFFIKRNNGLKEGGAKSLGMALEKLTNLKFLDLNLR